MALKVVATGLLVALLTAPAAQGAQKAGQSQAAPNCDAQHVCLEVDARTPLGVVDHRYQGFLHGVTPEADMAIIQPLQPASWQVNQAQTQGMARQLGAQTVWVLDDGWDWQYPGIPPWTVWPLYEDYVRSTVQGSLDHQQHVDYWDIAGEPNHGWLGTRDQMHEMFKRAHDVIRSVDADARIIATSQGEFSDSTAGADTITQLHDSDLAAFLDYAAAHAMEIDALSWHEIGTRPEDVAAHVARARQLVKDRPALLNSHPEIRINEYSSAQDWQIPGWTVGWLKAFFDAGVTAANRACWDRAPEDGQDQGPYSTCIAGLDGLLRRDQHTPTPLYWVHRSYADMRGEWLATTSSDHATSAIASRDDETEQIRILVGQFRKAEPNSTDLSTLTIRLQMPNRSVGRVRMAITRIPNHGGGGALASPPSTVVEQAVTRGAVTITLASVTDGDAYAIVIRPAAPGDSEAVAGSSLPTTGGSDTVALLGVVLAGSAAMLHRSRRAV